MSPSRCNHRRRSPSPSAVRRGRLSAPRPFLGLAREGGGVFRPIMKRCWIEVCAVGPHDRVDLRIDAHLPEQLGIAQRAEDFACENGLEIDGLLDRVCKREAQDIWPDDLDVTYAMNGMVHTVAPYRSGSIGVGGWPA